MPALVTCDVDAQGTAAVGVGAIAPAGIGTAAGDQSGANDALGAPCFACEVAAPGRELGTVVLDNDCATIGEVARGAVQTCIWNSRVLSRGTGGSETIRFGDDAMRTGPVAVNDIEAGVLRIDEDSAGAGAFPASTGGAGGVRDVLLGKLLSPRSKLVATQFSEVSRWPVVAVASSDAAVLLENLPSPRNTLADASLLTNASRLLVGPEGVEAAWPDAPFRSIGLLAAVVIAATGADDEQDDMLLLLGGMSPAGTMVKLLEDSGSGQFRIRNSACARAINAARSSALSDRKSTFSGRGASIDSLGILTKSRSAVRLPAADPKLAEPLGKRGEGARMGLVEPRPGTKT